MDIVLQLESLGLNDSEINEIFQLSARENEFYSVTQVEEHFVCVHNIDCEESSPDVQKIKKLMEIRRQISL